MTSNAISTRVVWAVADDKGVDPTELPPLDDAVDPDALNSLASHDASGTAGCTVRFPYAGRFVRVRGGEVSLEHPTPAIQD